MTTRTILCEHFDFSRTELFALIRAKRLCSLSGILARYGRGDGCEWCRSAICEILDDIRRQQKLSRRGRTSAMTAVPFEAAERECGSTGPDPFAPAEVMELQERVQERYAFLRRQFPVDVLVTQDHEELSPGRFVDVGFIWNGGLWSLSVCGQGGSGPRQGELLVEAVDARQVLSACDRFLTYYLLTADSFTRTTPWGDMLEGGIEHLREVLVLDQLGLIAELDELFLHYHRPERSQQCSRPGLWEDALPPDSRLTESGEDARQACSHAQSQRHTDVFSPEPAECRIEETSPFQTFTMKVEGHDVPLRVSTTCLCPEGSSSSLDSSLAPSG